MATDKQTNARLKRTYGITLDEYNYHLEQQNGVCAICFRPPIARRLHTDHDHSYKYVKVLSEKMVPGFMPEQRITWMAEGTYNGEYAYFLGKTKSEAVKQFRSWSKTASVRGLLCASCNRGLQFYRDKPELLENAAQYLRKFQNGL